MEKQIPFGNDNKSQSGCLAGAAVAGARRKFAGIHLGQDSAFRQEGRIADVDFGVFQRAALGGRVAYSSKAGQTHGAVRAILISLAGKAFGICSHGEASLGISLVTTVIALDGYRQSGGQT